MASVIEEPSLGKLLSTLRSCFPPSLVDDKGWHRLVERIGGLPGWDAICQGIGFEFRLGTHESACDFFVSTAAGHQAWEWYAQGRSADPDTAEAALGRLLTRLEKRQEGRHPACMLEYDIAEVPPGENPAPGVFLRSSIPGIPVEETLPKALAGLLTAMGWVNGAKLARVVERTSTLLAPDCRITSVGAMPEREIQAVRLTTSGVEIEQFPALLERLGWSGPVQRVRSALADFADLRPLLRIALDAVADGLAPRVGLELSPLPDQTGDNTWMLTGRRDWRPIAQRVEAQGLCHPEKLGGLLAWPGRDQIFTSRGVFTIYRGINHIKLSIEDGQAVHAKAYTGLAALDFNKANHQAE